MSSVSLQAFKLIPSSVLNKMTLTQINGLSSSQAAAILQSPNAVGLDSSISTALNIRVSNSQVTSLVEVNNGGVNNHGYKLGLNQSNLFLSFLLIFTLTS